MYWRQLWTIKHKKHINVIYMVCTVVMSGLYSVAKYTPSATLTDWVTVELCIMYWRQLWTIKHNVNMIYVVCTVVMSGLYSVAKHTPSATLTHCRAVRHVLWTITHKVRVHVIYVMCTVVMSGLYSMAKYTPSATLTHCIAILSLVYHIIYGACQDN